MMKGDLACGIPNFSGGLEVMGVLIYRIFADLLVLWAH